MINKILEFFRWVLIGEVPTSVLVKNVDMVGKEEMNKLLEDGIGYIK